MSHHKINQKNSRRKRIKSKRTSANVQRRIFFFSLLLTATTWGIVEYQLHQKHPTIAEQTSSKTSLENQDLIISPNHPTLSPDVELDNLAQTPSQEKPNNSADEVKFQAIMKLATTQNWHQLSMGEIMQKVSEQLLGSQYKAGLLDQYSQETLVASLTQFDCVLFVETVLALTRGIVIQNYQYSTFLEHLTQQRYWNGNLNGYCSRLHYFSEWIADNQRREIVKNIALDLGGTQINKKLNFMSNHRSSYPQLVNNENNYQCIQEMEKNLTNLTIDYLPTKQIKTVYNQLQSGDIIGITTNIAGLDVTHTGLVYRNQDGNIGLIHASPIGEVTIASDLQTYVSKVENSTGILVARPIDLRYNR
jgi:hypothetical protein